MSMQRKFNVKKITGTKRDNGREMTPENCTSSIKKTYSCPQEFILRVFTMHMSF